MTKRGKQLHATADDQIAELIGLLSTLDEAMLRLPCPGREKLAIIHAVMVRTIAA